MQQNRISNRKLFWLKFIEIFKSFEKRIFRYVEFHRFCDGKPLSFHHHKIYCNQNIKEYLNCPATFLNDFFIIVLAIFFYKRRQRKSKQRNPRHQQRNDRVMENQFAQPNLPTNQNLETENIGTVASCPSYSHEEFNTGYQLGVISDNPPPYVLHNSLQSYWWRKVIDEFSEKLEIVSKIN